MENPYFARYRTTGSRLFILASGYLMLTLFGSLVFGTILIFLMKSSSSMAVNGTDANIVFLKWTQLFMTILSFLLPALLLSVASYPRGLPYLRADKKCSFTVLLSVLILILAVQPLLNIVSAWCADWSLPSFLSWLEHWLKNLESQNEELFVRFLDVNSVGGLLANVVIVAVAPAICEEFFFRGGLQQLFCEKMNKHLAIWLAAILFSAVHLDASGFVPRAFLGALLGYLFVWTGSIWVPVAVHFVNNLCGVLVEYLIFNQYADKSLERFGASDTSWILLLGTAVFAVLLVVVYRSRVPESTALPPDTDIVEQ